METLRAMLDFFNSLDQMPFEFQALFLCAWVMYLCQMVIIVSNYKLSKKKKEAV
jgi:hypothetical protein